MAIRRPSVYNKNQFVFQDFLFSTEGLVEHRYIETKYDGEVFNELEETFDLTSEFKGGSVVARIDYSLEGTLVTIDHWEVYWRDEWPLRLTVQFLSNCLYSRWQGYTVRVRKESEPFWISERFLPLTNDPNDFLIKSE